MVDHSDPAVRQACRTVEGEELLVVLKAHLHQLPYVYRLENPVRSLPGNPNGGGIGPPGPAGCANIGFELACPSAAYEFVIESITDCAFSWPISAGQVRQGPIQHFVMSVESSLDAHHAEHVKLTLVIVDHIPQMIPAAVVRFPHAHRVMCKVHIAVVTWWNQ